MFEILGNKSVHIVSVGSVDGVCTTAAVLRTIGRDDVGLEFCQAFTVDRVNPAAWKSGCQVIFVDLAVNNRDPQMTAGFIARLKEAGHTLVAIIDEHSREDWEKVLGSFEGLTIEPQSQMVGDNAPKSSGEVLRRVLMAGGAGLDHHSVELLQAADAGDRMDFTTHFGGLVNQAIKSKIQDDTRRVYLAKHFATNYEPDEQIRQWIAEYEVIMANHDKVVASKIDLGDGIIRVIATGFAVDMTTLMGRLYKDGATVVALEGEAFNKSLGKKTIQIAFGTNDKGLDLLAVVKVVVPTASGFAQKVNVDPEHEQVAIDAIRKALRS
ncbi:MAG: hypothetical protein Q7S16_04375 [bacterium]|nr:hypothetical protein [bacterium]